MKDKIYLLLDELVAMSESKYSIEGINSEILNIDKRINRINKTISKFERGIDDSKYFDVASQMVDKNLEVNLEKRIKKLSDSVEEIEQHIQETLSREQEAHDKLKSVSKSALEYEKLIEILKNKASNLDDPSSKNVYEDLIADNETQLAKYRAQENDINTLKNEISEELNMLTSSKNELVNRIHKEQEKLDDTKKELANEKNYYNYDEKKDDEKYLQDLKLELEELEKNKLSLLTDAANLGYEAKILITDEKNVEALAKIKELIGVIELIPEIAEEDIDKLNNRYDELRAEIENKKNEIGEKDYKTDSNMVLEKRVANLNALLSSLKSKKTSIEDMISDIDTKLVIDLKLEINNANLVLDELNENLDSFKELDSRSSNISLQSTIIAYDKEAASVKEVISKQNSDLEKLVGISESLQKVVAELEETIEEKQNDLENTERNTRLKSKLVNEKERIEDEEQLDKLQKKLKYIENRFNNKKTPKAIYSEIEKLLNELDFKEIEKELQKNESKEDKKVVEAPKKRLKIIDVDDDFSAKQTPSESEEVEHLNLDEIIKLLGE